MKFSATFSIAACSILELASAAPFSSDTSNRSLNPRATYTMFGGDGSAANGWPSRQQWMPFDTAWNANLATIRQSCGTLGWGPNDSDAEIQAIKDAITKVSASSGMPKEYILAIMMQESKGCVRAPTTSWGHANPGLMQSAMGPGTCNPSTTASSPITPCPSATIYQMIFDGTSNPALGTTLLSSLRSAGSDEPARWYRAARIYNAGGVTDDNLGIGPTPCYASDIANRLVMQFAASPCDPSRIASVGSSSGGGGGGKPAQVPISGPGTATTPAPKQIIAGTSTSCKAYWVPAAGSNCSNAGVDTATLRRLNPQLNADCTNLWAGYGYCVQA